VSESKLVRMPGSKEKVSRQREFAVGCGWIEK